MSLMPWLKDINQDLFKKYLEGGNFDFIKSHYLDYLDSIKFEAAFKNHKELIKEKNYKQIKCAFITNFNLDFIYPSLFCSGIRSDIFFEIYKSEFNTSIQDALAENTELSKFNPSYLIIYVNLDFFDPKFPCNIKKQNDLEVLFSIAMKYSRLGTKIIFANLTENTSSNFGDYDLLNDNSIRFNVRELNNRVYKFCKDNNFLLFDTNYLSSSIGSKEFFSLKNQLISKSPYNFDYIPLLTDKLSKIISSSLGLQKKCLVLDLDNTLWGGVIGDSVCRVASYLGCDVSFTYKSSKEDSFLIVDDIKKHCNSNIQAFELDVTSLKSIQALNYGYDILCYFPSDKIFGKSGSYFDIQRFEKFYKIYCVAFSQIARRFIESGGKVIYYPSSKAVESNIKGLEEYAFSKKIGEEICKSLVSEFNVEIICDRLDRIETKQTLSVIPIPARDPADVAIDICKIFSH